MTFMEPLRLVRVKERLHNEVYRPFVWHLDGIRHRRHNGIGLELEIVHKRADGSVKYKKTFKARSYVTAYLVILQEQMDATNAVSILDTGGVSRVIGTDSSNFDITASSGDVTHGIVLGTGTNTPTPADYQLQLPIAHGVGAGQLSYGVTTAGGAGAVGNRSTMLITRGVTNNSGNPITVNEVALVCTATSSNWKILITRDVIPSGRVIANLESVTFTLKVFVDT